MPARPSTATVLPRPPAAAPSAACSASISCSRSSSVSVAPDVIWSVPEGLRLAKFRDALGDSPDAAPPAPAEDWPMRNDELVRAIAELEVDGQSVRGVLRCDRDGNFPFEGWLGLIAALESARSLMVLETVEASVRGGVR